MMEIVRKNQDRERPPFRTLMRPVCINCCCQMECTKNGVQVHLESSDAYVSGDKYTCPECEWEIVTGFADCAVYYTEEPENVVARIDY